MSTRSLLDFALFIFYLVVFVPQPFHFQGVLHGGTESSDAIFEKIIGRAMFHGFNGDVFAYRS